MLRKIADEQVLRTPEVEELEELWGFERGHTVSAVKSAALKEAFSSWLRKRLLSRGITTKVLERKVACVVTSWNLDGGDRERRGL